MPSKTEEYLALAQRTANGLTRYWESWTDYLTTASRLYKYPFADQLMIYAQRPDATACADYDIWNNRMNRYVRRGSKGIALLDESSGFPRLHYVFDVSDTGVRRNSRDPDLWQYNDDLKQPVSEMLAATYGISGERVSQQLADVAGKLVADYWDNNSEDISAIVDGSLLMDYDEAGVEMQFKSAAAISVTYTLLERCGFEPDGYFDKDSFQAIYNFSTPDTVYTLGAAVSDISREVLRTVERAVKTTIRRRNNERSQHEYEQQSELHADRGLSSPEPDPASAKDPAGQVRQDAPELSETAAPGAVPHDAPEREPVPDSDRTGADRSSNEGADDSRSAGEEPGTGQREEPDSVGAAHEQPAGAGRGSDSDGTDLQLSLLDADLYDSASFEAKKMIVSQLIRRVDVYRGYQMQERIDAATARYHELGDSIKAAETRMAEIAVLRTHIVNYARTRPVYDAYRKAGYSKRFLEAHREEITLHKAAKTAFDEAGLKKLPKAKDLSIEYAELLKKKKEAYPDYRKARDEMQELMKAQKNVEMFFAEEKSTTEKEQAR